MLEAEGVPAAEVRDIAQVFAGAQTEALGAVQTLHHPDAGDYRVVGAPVRFDRPPFPYPSAAPRWCGHAEVLTEVGLSPDAVDELVSAGVAIARDRTTMGDAVLRRTIELAEVPAPTGFEGNRAAMVRSWWATKASRTWAWMRPGTCGPVRAEGTATPWSCAPTSTRCSVPANRT